PTRRTRAGRTATAAAGRVAAGAAAVAGCRGAAPAGRRSQWSAGRGGPMSALLLERDVAAPLARRNPTVKLALVFVVSIVVMFVLDPVTPAVLYLLALVAVLTTTR